MNKRDGEGERDKRQKALKRSCCVATTVCKLFVKLNPNKLNCDFTLPQALTQADAQACLQFAYCVFAFVRRCSLSSFLSSRLPTLPSKSFGAGKQRLLILARLQHTHAHAHIYTQNGKQTEAK